MSVNKIKFEDFRHYFVTLHKSDTGLPMNVFVDEANGCERCGVIEGLFFQTNEEEKFTGFKDVRYVSLVMGFYDQRWFEKFPKPENARKLLFEFIRNNELALFRLANQELCTSEFLNELMVSGGIKPSIDLWKKTEKKVKSVVKKHSKMIEDI